MAYVRMKVDRREFVFGTVAMTALASFGKAAAGRPLVKLGVVSDIHVADDTCRAYRMFVKALEYFRSIEVDGVLIPGDLADLGRTEQLEAVIAAWEKVFPSSRLPNGEKVENLHFGFTRIHTQKRVMAAGHVYADESAVKTDECAFALSELPENADIRFVIRPLNAFGHAGRPIMSEVMKRGERK